MKVFRARIRGWSPWSAVVILGLGAATLVAVEPDPAVAAATAALAIGQPLQVVHLLHDHPGLARPGLPRLLLARAQVALGRGPEALSALGSDGLRDARPLLSAWPATTRGAAFQVAAEALLVQGAELALAREWLEQACRCGGEEVGVDRCLVLLIDLCRQTGDAAAAEHYAEALWLGWPRSPYRGHAGLQLARQRSVADPDRARELLAQVRISDPLGDQDRLSAAELLCRLLLDAHPGQCLVVAEQELKRLAGRDTGLLPLYRALALGNLDPQEGVAVLEALPEALRADPAAQAAMARLRAEVASGRRADLARRLERARAEVELGRLDAARAMLEPLCAQEPMALVALAALPGFDPDRYLACPAAAHPAAALALGRALLATGRSEVAWPMLKAVLAKREAGACEELPLATVLYWAAEAASTAAPVEAQRLRARLLALDEAGVETGLTWCAEAQRLEGARQEADAAWRQALARLPDDHPWKPGVAWRVARRMLERDGDAEVARQLLAQPAYAGDEADQLRCRFLLVQALERLDDRNGALRVAEALLPLADTDQRARLERILTRLRQASP